MGATWRGLLALSLLLPALPFAAAQRNGVPHDDRDLMTFVTRPDLKPAKFNVTRYEGGSISPGYWFVSPYVDLHTRPPTSLYSAGQLGPHIYDGNGELVWSGAHLMGDHTTFDFRVAVINGTQHLTYIAGEDIGANLQGTGSGHVVNASYVDVRHWRNPGGSGLMNMHEWYVVDDGRYGLMITFMPQLVDVSRNPEEERSAWIGNNGFVEIDLQTGKKTFEWWALDHVHALDSLVRRPSFPGAHTQPWDFFHMNSVDKDENGDYLISVRFFSCIFKISGKDGSIIWRLGGQESSFELNGFNFSSQHDARFHRGNSKMIRFLNNAADSWSHTSRYSSGMLVSLDESEMTADLVQSWPRPDESLSRLRGNVQDLPNGNTFISWSENGYISEFDNEGNLVLDAQFASRRFVTYRAYKFNFTGLPMDVPTLKAFAYGVEPEDSTTVLYVSWNGATEVTHWKFYSLDTKRGQRTLLETVEKKGFETQFMTHGYSSFAVVEAIDASGMTLGTSVIERVVVPDFWDGKGIKHTSSESSSHINIVHSSASQQPQKPNADDEAPYMPANMSVPHNLPNPTGHGRPGVKGAGGQSNSKQTNNNKEIDDDTTTAGQQSTGQQSNGKYFAQLAKGWKSDSFRFTAAFAVTVVTCFAGLVSLYYAILQLRRYLALRSRSDLKMFGDRLS